MPAPVQDRLGGVRRVHEANRPAAERMRLHNTTLLVHVRVREQAQEVVAVRRVRRAAELVVLPYVNAVRGAALVEVAVLQQPTRDDRARRLYPVRRSPDA